MQVSSTKTGAQLHSPDYVLWFFFLVNFVFVALHFSFLPEILAIACLLTTHFSKNFRNMCMHILGGLILGLSSLYSYFLYIRCRDGGCVCCVRPSSLPCEHTTIPTPS